MATVLTYDPGNVICIVEGVPMSGFAKETFIKVERDEDTYTKVVGGDGQVSRSRSHNRSGTITLTLAQTSPSNDVLSGFALLDEISNSGVVNVFIKDNSGRSTFASAKAWVRKFPSAEFGIEVSNREWVLDCADLNIFVGGN